MTPPSAMPRRVLMTADTIGGVWQYALELTRGLTRAGVEVALATMGAPLSTAQRTEADAIAGLTLHESRFPLEWMPNPWEEMEDAGAWLLDLEEQFRPDVIHLNGYSQAALPWRAPVLVVAHSCVLSWWQAVHGAPAPAEWARYEERVRAGVHAAGLVVAPTVAMLQGVDDLYGQPAEGLVIHNCADPARFVPATKEPFIFAAGRLGDPAKNIATLAESAAGLPWPVVVAGAESDATGAAPLPPNLQSRGRLTTAELADHMGRASIYCLPARYEPFGLSILEAALCQCPLVLGDIPSLRELWDGAAVLVNPGDSVGLRSALLRLIEHPEERANAGERARNRALQFTQAKTVAAYLAAYQSLCGTPAFAHP